MKTKLAAALMIFVMMFSLLYGCGLIVVDQYKDMQQVIVTVGDENYKDEILKKDLANIFRQQGSQYMQQYQLTVKQTMEILLNQLINNRIIIQEATKILIEKNNLEGTLKDYLGKDKTTGKISDSIKKLVGDEAYERAKGNVYKYEKEMLDYYEEQVKKEKDPDATPEPTPEPTPTPRPTRKPDGPEPTETPHPANPDIEDEPETRQEAYRRIIDDLKKSDKKNKNKTAQQIYDEFFEDNLVSQLENEIMELYRQHLIEDIRVDLNKMKERHANMLNAEQHKYAIDLDAVGTKLESAGEDTFVLYNPVSGYGYVKNLLVSFDDKLSDSLAELQNTEWSKQQYIKYREQLLNDIVVKNLADEEDDVEYDINDFVSDKLTSIYGGTLDENYDNEVYTTGLQGQDLEEFIDDFIDLIFDYGTDPGMFNNTMDYLVSPKTQSGEEKYVKEFAEAARDVIDAGIGSYALVGTDFGWHIILCTEVMTAGDVKDVEDSVHTQITDLLDGGTKFEDITGLNDDFTFKLYKLMREELKSSIFNNAIMEVVERYKDKIVKYEDRYKDYLEL